MVTIDRVRDATGSIPLPARPTAPRAVAMTGAQMAELTLLLVAGALLLFSVLLPYWQITLHAPQYPKGLMVQAYTYQLTGDVSEVDGLNHYIGMMKLDEAAAFERQISLVAIPLIAFFAVASFYMRGIWRMLARVPIIIFPIVFIADLFGWLYYAGHSLDPHAALSSSIKPFTPSVVGTGGIGQFSTEAVFLPGFMLAVIAAVAVLAVSISRRSAADVAR